MIYPLLKLSNTNLLCPFYHTVSDVHLPHIANLYSYYDTKTFEKHLDFYLKHFKPIDLQQLINYKINGFPKNYNYFFLSFDDGLREFYDICQPILLRKGIPATVFVNSDFVDNKGLFYRYKTSLIITKIKTLNIKEQLLLHKKHNPNQFHTPSIGPWLKTIGYQNQSILDDIGSDLGINFIDFLASNEPYMTTLQLQELIKKGFTIGAHSANHPLYNKISLTDQLIQTKKSLDFVAESFGQPYKVFSFPFTDAGVSNSFFDTIYNDYDVNLSFGTAGIKKDTVTKNIQRLAIEKSYQSIYKTINYNLLKAFIKDSLAINVVKRK